VPLSCFGAKFGNEVSPKRLQLTNYVAPNSKSRSLSRIH